VAEEPRVAEELQKMEYEPLLPVEKQMVGWSIGLGITLLFLLYGISVLLIPVGE
jgi:hypothetical protein